MEGVRREEAAAAPSSDGLAHEPPQPKAATSADRAVNGSAMGTAMVARPPPPTRAAEVSVDRLELAIGGGAALGAAVPEAAAAPPERRRTEARRSRAAVRLERLRRPTATWGGPRGVVAVAGESEVAGSGAYVSGWLEIAACPQASPSPAGKTGEAESVSAAGQHARARKARV